jgi:DNA-directed RNA polymerase subunit RPC12/RpoP
MQLACSSRCGSRLFRALFAEVDIDPSGEFVDYRVAQPGYVCLNCGAPALDLATVQSQMEADEAEDDPPVVVVDILCPVCETLVQVGDEMECPNCGAPLEAAEA